MTVLRIMGAAALAAMICGGAVDTQAAERKVRLKVPEMVCASRGAVAVATATSVNGVSSADDDLDNSILTVVYDDSKTSVEEIRKAMAKGSYPVEGEPVFVEPK